MPPELPPDLVAFIETQPRTMPYSALAELLRQRFGERAVDADILRHWWQTKHRAHERCLLRRDSEVRRAVLDVAGRLNGREIMEMLAGRFAPSRVPSRSVLYRFLADEARAPHSDCRDDRSA